MPLILLWIFPFDLASAKAHFWPFFFFFGGGLLYLFIYFLKALITPLLNCSAQFWGKRAHAGRGGETVAVSIMVEATFKKYFQYIKRGTSAFPQAPHCSWCEENILQNTDRIAECSSALWKFVFYMEISLNDSLTSQTFSLMWKYFLLIFFIIQIVIHHVCWSSTCGWTQAKVLIRWWIRQFTRRLRLKL